MADILLDLFQAKAYPELANAVAAGQNAILCLWQAEVRKRLPHADKLTLVELRDSLPNTLSTLVQALACTEPANTRALIAEGGEHGITRFHQSFNLVELLLEYDLLRPILVTEAAKCLNREITLGEIIALNTGLDLASRRSVVGFATHQRQQLQKALQGQLKTATFLSRQVQQILIAATTALQATAGRLARGEETPACLTAIGAVVHQMEELSGGVAMFIDEQGGDAVHLPFPQDALPQAS